MQVIMIALFGALGCAARFGVSSATYRLLGSRFPYGILTVNLLGSFLVGFLAVLFMQKWQFHPMWQKAIIIGFLGGFTTFSSFSYDVYQMLHHGAWLKASLYALASVLLGVVATFLGAGLAGIWK